MLKVKQAYTISKIVDKMDLQINAGKSQQELGADLIMQLLKKAHKAEAEITQLIADYKNITTDQAQELDLISTFTEIFADEGITSFFKSAVK